MTRIYSTDTVFKLKKATKEELISLIKDMRIELLKIKNINSERLVAMEREYHKNYFWKNKRNYEYCPYCKAVTPFLKQLESWDSGMVNRKYCLRCEKGRPE